VIRATIASAGVWLILCLVVSSPAEAQDLEPRGAGSGETALAGAAVVANTGANSLWVNPANLPPGWNMVATFGLHSDQRSVFRDSPTINETLPEARDLAGVVLAPAVAIAVAPARGLRVGLGYHTGLQIQSDYGAKAEDPVVRYTGSALTLRQHVVTLGVGLRWRWVSLGLALQLSHMRLSYQRTLWAGLASDRDRLQSPQLDLTAAFRGNDGITLLGLIGIRLRPLRWLHLGLSFWPPVTVGLDGTLLLATAAQTTTPRGYVEMSAADGSAHLDLHLPLELRAGASLVLRWLRVHLELRHARWSSVGEPAAAVESAAVLLKDVAQHTSSWPVTELPVGLMLDDRTSLHLGLELPDLAGLLTVQLGYAYHMGATTGDAPGSTLLDLDRHVLGLGLTARRGGWEAGVGVQHSFRGILWAGGDRSTLLNPLAPEVTEAVGRGRYLSSSTRVVLELGKMW